MKIDEYLFRYGNLLIHAIQSGSRRKFLMLLGGCMLLGLALRTGAWTKDPVPSRDAYYYVMVMTGQKQNNMQIPPMLLLILKGCEKLGIDPMRGAAIINLLLGTALLGIIGLLVEKTGAGRAVAIGATLFAAFNIQLVRYSYLVQRETPMLFGAALTLLWILPSAGKQNPLKTLQWGLAGVAMAFAVASRLEAIAELSAAALICLHQFPGHRWRRGLCFLGALAATLYILSYLTKNDIVAAISGRIEHYFL